MKQVKRPCNHQKEDSEEKIPFNYCPWCGKFLAAIVDPPKDEKKCDLCSTLPHPNVKIGCKCPKCGKKV